MNCRPSNVYRPSLNISALDKQLMNKKKAFVPLAFPIMCMCIRNRINLIKSQYFFNWRCKILIKISTQIKKC